MFKYAITRTSSYELWGPTSTKFVHLHSLSRKKNKQNKTDTYYAEPYRQFKCAKKLRYQTDFYKGNLSSYCDQFG